MANAKQATKPILDSKTGTDYPTMYQAGKALGTTLCPEYTGAPRLIWFAMVRKYPGRFKTKSTTGEWVELNDPNVPKITRIRKSQTDEQRKISILAELGEIEARKQAKAATKAGTQAAAAVEAAEEVAVEGEEEEVEAEAAAPTPGPAKKKLAAALKQS